MHSRLLICNTICSSAPSLNPDRSAILRKSATLSKVGTIRLHFRPPSTQLKPISIFLKGKFEAAHSRKVGTIPPHFHPPSTQLKPISIFLKGKFEAAHSRKVGICRAPRALTVVRLSCRSAFLSFPSQDTGRLSTCRKPHRLCFGFRPQCSFQS